mmetsp:Transcript_28128/g.59388  ORF Transcript_28128/g.59388 Transcript_28128/m.59388 type:complete len:289 (-) Transcript_28128:308-1174(-)
MVLGSNVALSSGVVDHRLVLTTVPEWKFLRLSSSSNSQKLVSQTDSENGLHLTVWNRNGLLQLLNRFLTVGWITRSVGEEDSIKLVHVSREGMVPWYNRKFAAPVYQQSNHVVLHTTINTHNLDGVALSVHLGLRNTHFRNQMTHVGVLPRRWRRGVQINLNSTNHSTLLTNFLRQHTRVNIGETWDALLLEPIPETGGCVPVRIMMGIVLHNETGSVDFVGFEHCRQTEFVQFLSVRYTIVSYHGGSECYDLSLIRRVSQRLRVANHTSSENNLSSSTLVTTKTPSS